MEEDCLIGRKFVRSGSPCLHIFFYSFAVIRYISFMMGVFIKVSGWPGWTRLFRQIISIRLLYSVMHLFPGQRFLLAHPQVRLWVSGHTHTRPKDGDFMTDANCYHGRILNVYNADWDNESDIYTNSLYLFEDKIVIRTYSHRQHAWLPQFDRVIAATAVLTQTA